MNGCCQSHADGGGHYKCYWYWPCGCRKVRIAIGVEATPHVHPAVKYVEKKDRHGEEYTDYGTED